MGVKACEMEKEMKRSYGDYLTTAFLAWQTVLSVTAGAVLFANPEIPLSLIFSRGFDGIHMHMARCVGSVLIGQAVLCILWTKSSDKSVKSTVLYNRLLVSGLCVALCFNAMSEDVGMLFQPSAVKFLLVVLLFDIVLSTSLLIIADWPKGICLLSPRKRLVNILSQVDYIACVIIGSLWYSMPAFLLKNQVRIPLDITHVFVSRMFGAHLLSSGVFSTSSQYFKSEIDRLFFIFARAAMCLSILFGQLYSQYAYAAWWKHTHWVGIALFSIWTGLAMLVFAREMYKFSKGIAE